LSISKKINSHACVIGSGVGGLAAAARLAARGMQVSVFEKNDAYGGKVSPITTNGYLWGFGASLFTLPELLDELFVSCRQSPSDYYSYTQIDPICRYFFPDGTIINAFAQPDLFAAEVASKTGEPSAHILSFLKEAERKYELTKDIFLFHSLHKFSTYTNRKAIHSLFNLSSLGILKKMNTVNEKKFSDARIVQLFNRYATYNGSNPYVAPSTLNVIAHLEYNKGAYYLQGGMPALTESLYQLCLNMGVKFTFNAMVNAIHITDNRVTGINVGNTNYAADVVVSNMDIVYTYRNLMPELPEPKRFLAGEKSSSAIIFYWGIKDTFSNLELHNILFSGNYKAEFDCITNKKIVYDDPTIYIYISSKMDKAHAPEGCENWFVMVNAPHDCGQDWSQIITEARKNILKKLKIEAGLDIESLISCEIVNHPGTIQEKTLSHLGALYGNSSNTILSAFLRHPNFSQSIKGLYFSGGSVHPGGGVPLCLLSAKIVDELVD